MEYRYISRKKDIRVCEDYSDIEIRLDGHFYSVKRIMENFMYIVDKNGESVVFKMNAAQQILYRKICERLYKRKPCRFIILKGRQLGCTTFIVILEFIFIMFRANQSGIVIANTNENANKIFAKIRALYDALKKHAPALTRGLVSKTGNQLVTQTESSSIRVAPSTMDAVRGTTITFFEGSEVAFWEDIDEILAAVLEAIPPFEINPATFVFLESTPNGFNGFKDYWDHACSMKEEDTDIVPVFLGRYLDPLYRTFEPLREEELTTFEREKMKRHNLDLYQMGFFRAKLKSHKFDLAKTLQEYPFDPSDAFTSTGSGVFNTNLIEKRKEEVRDLPYKKGYLTHKITPIANDVDRLVMSEIDFKESEIGYINIYEEPKKGVPYVIGVDMAVGLGNDNSAAFVYRNDTKVQVASMTINTLPADTYSYDVVALAKYYNNALINPEVNYGTTLIRILKKFDYENIYQSESDDTLTYESYVGSYGTKTTQRNKAAMVDNFRAICEDDDHPYSNIKDYNLLIEMGTFIYDYGKGNSQSSTVKIKGAGKAHDDRVMAAVLAYAGSNQQRTFVLKENITITDELPWQLRSEKSQDIRGLWHNTFIR